MIKLNVPFEEKDMAKGLGAKWNLDFKTWYVPHHYEDDLRLFQKWLPSEARITTNFLNPKENFILEGQNECWNCKNMTTIVTLAVVTSLQYTHYTSLQYTHYTFFNIY